MAANDKSYTWQMYQQVFLSEPGKEVLEDLKKAHHFLSSTAVRFGYEPLDPLAMAIAEGERNVILRIMAILESKEEDYNA